MTKVCSKSLFFNHSLTGKALLIIILMFSSFPESTFAQKPFKIVIDAGHGGKDPGRPNKSGIKEKDIVLNIALDLGKKLKNSGNEVIYTRDKDVFLTLRQRAKIAMKQMQIFLSQYIVTPFMIIKFMVPKLLFMVYM